MGRKKIVISLDEVRDEYESAQMLSCKPDETFKRPKIGTVLDEDKSVKWNREEVLRLREAYDEEVKRLNTLKNQMRDKACSTAVNYIVQKTGLSVEQARRFWNNVSNKFHDDIANYGDIFYELDEFIKKTSRRPIPTCSVWDECV